VSILVLDVLGGFLRFWSLRMGGAQEYLSNEN